MLKRNEHFCKVRSTFVPKVPTSAKAESIPMPTPQYCEFHSDMVRVDLRISLSLFKRNLTSWKVLDKFARPEEIGITVEYINPSLLVKKPTGEFLLLHLLM